MLYYELFTNLVLNEDDIKKRKLPLNKHELWSYNIVPLVIEKLIPENPEVEGVKPDGFPKPDPDDPSQYIQKMTTYSILDEGKKKLKEAITDRRWKCETEGIILPNNVFVLTGVDDQNRISTALQGMKDAGLTEVDFKGADGWSKVSLEELQQIASAIAVHVQKCFSAERALHEKVDAATTLTELNAIDISEGFPTYSYTYPETPEEENPEEPPEERPDEDTEEKEPEPVPVPEGSENQPPVPENSEETPEVNPDENNQGTEEQPPTPSDFPEETESNQEPETTTSEPKKE